MTDETLEKIIDSLNIPEAPDLIFLRPLTNKVFVGRVWLKLPSGGTFDENSYTMFFVRNQRKTVVAAVLDMGKQDLHIFVKPKHRGRGYLADALRSVILPFLFASGRKEQQITFRTEQAKHHAQIVGFRLLTDAAAVITPDDLPAISAPTPKLVPSSDGQVKRIKQRIWEAAAFLRIARDDIQTAFGDDEASKLNSVAASAEQHASHIHDLWHARKLSNNQGRGRKKLLRHR
ncbi:MAG: hypothetical protein NTV58_06665 [Deltaproteobacteria bacterium]|nr:hypothetical protein [Deltaproteobacteria bacterium]